MDKATIVGLRVRLPKGTQVFSVVDAGDSFVELRGETNGAKVLTSRGAVDRLLREHPEYEVN